MLDVRKEDDTDKYQRYINETNEKNQTDGSQSLVVPQVELFRVLASSNSNSTDSTNATNNTTKKQPQQPQQPLILTNVEVIKFGDSDDSDGEKGGTVLAMNANDYLKGNGVIVTTHGRVSEHMISSIVTVVAEDSNNDTMTLMCDNAGCTYMKKNIIEYGSNCEMEKWMKIDTYSNGDGSDINCEDRNTMVFRWNNANHMTSKWYGITNLNDGKIIIIMPDY